MDMPQNKKASRTLILKASKWWKHTDSNRGPSACKADALNQLSYASLKGLQR